MIVSYPPFYPQQILDADGNPVAGGHILSFYAGTDVPLAMFAPDGTSLGSSVSIASDGTAVFCLKVGTPYKLVCVDADGATIWTRDKVKVSAGDGLVNPMAALGDLIVGGEDGVPSRLGVGSAGQVPTAQADGSIAWEDTRGFGKVSAASGDASASYLDNKLDVTTPLEKEVTTGQHNVKRVKLSVSAGDAAGKVLTTTDNGLGVLVPTWQTPTGMENPMTAKADIIVGGASGAPDKLAAPANASFLRAYKNSSNENVVNWSKLSAGSGVTITDAGTQVTISADTQTGDHQLLVSATDEAAGYLGAKLTAGSNVTLTTQTDGDGVQTLEISAAGGGGGGGSEVCLESFSPLDAASGSYEALNDVTNCFLMFFPKNFTPSSAEFYFGSTSFGSSKTFCIRIYTYVESSGAAQIVYVSTPQTANTQNITSVALAHNSTYHASPVLEGGKYIVAVSCNSTYQGWLTKWPASSKWGAMQIAGINPADTFTFTSGTSARAVHLIIRGSLS